VDKLNVNYTISYLDKQTSPIDVAVKTGDNTFTVKKGGEDYNPDFDIKVQEGLCSIFHKGQKVYTFEPEVLESPEEDNDIVFIGDKRYRASQKTTGEFVLQEVTSEIILIDEGTKRKQGGQRKDVFHTLYELKHQKAITTQEHGVNLMRPEIRGDNKSTEYLSFPDVIDLMAGCGGASGSVASASKVMLKLFKNAEGVRWMDPAFAKKGAEKMPVFVSTNRIQWKRALSRIKEIYTNSPGASMIIYFDDVRQAKDFQKELEKMIAENDLERTAKGPINVQVFDEEGAKEVELVNKAGQPNTITLSDAKLGRATNVTLPEEVGFLMDNAKKALSRHLKRIRSRAGPSTNLDSYISFLKKLSSEASITKNFKELKSEIKSFKEFTGKDLAGKAEFSDIDEQNMQAIDDWLELVRAELSDSEKLDKYIVKRLGGRFVFRGEFR
jgi:hypothetical protein